jgi:hypothetical protein
VIKAIDQQLEGVGIIERDDHGDVIMTWSHPVLQPAGITQVAISRAKLDQNLQNAYFSFSKFGPSWIYQLSTANPKSTPSLSRVTAFCIVIVTKAFNPEKYGSLCKCLTDIYATSGTPVKVLEAWLIAVRGAHLEGYDPLSFTKPQAMLATSIKDIVKLFDEQTIHIWSAILMKKRVAVYSDRIGHVLRVIRALPLFSFHRQDWDVLRPYVSMSEPEMAELQNSGVYVAGFTDSSIKRRLDLWDVLIDIPEKKITINDEVQDTFSESSFHKDLSSYLIESAADDEVSSEEVIAETMKKTKALLARLESLKTVNEETGEGYITFEALQERKLPAGLDRFLFIVAVAEGMTKMY